MSDRTIDFFDLIVAPAITEFREADKELTEAAAGEDAGKLDAARALALRRARTAAIELHQFTDRVVTERPTWAPSIGIDETRDWLMKHHCHRRPDDVLALHDVADAFKHVELTRPRKDRAWFVKSDRAVINLATGFGELGWGEGKWGGVEEIIIEQPDGRKRSLAFVLETVFDAWRRAMAPADPPLS